MVGPQPLPLHGKSFVLALQPSPASGERVECTGLLLQIMNDLVDDDAAVPHVAQRIEPVIEIDCRTSGIPAEHLTLFRARHGYELAVRDKFDKRELRRGWIIRKGLHNVQQVRNQSGNGC